MKFFDPNNPNEKKKAIIAGVLGLGAIGVLGYALFGGGSSKPTNNGVAKATPTPARQINRTTNNQTQSQPDDPSLFRPIVLTSHPLGAPEPNRNIFSYYEPPPPPVKVETPRAPSPTPTPPLNVTSLAPASVYARTADFSLQVSGDKFTPAVRITMDGRELPTRFVNAQQIATTVPADLIASPGTRSVVVRTSDNSLYSLPVSLNVTPPPVPNFNYIGLIGKPRFNDIAVLQDKSNNKELRNVVRGDVLGGRFRVTSISEKEVVLTDTQLKINHKLPFTVDNSPGANQPYRPRAAEDEPML